MQHFDIKILATVFVLLMPYVSEIDAAMNAFNQYEFQGFSEDFEKTPITAEKTYRDVIKNDPNLKDRITSICASRILYRFSTLRTAKRDG